MSARVGRRRPLVRLAAIYGTAVLVIGLDQLIKYLVVRQLAGRPPFRIIGDVVELRYATNSGGAFSLLTGAPVFFALMAIVVIGGILYASSRARGLPIAVALGLLLGRPERSSDERGGRPDPRAGRDAASPGTRAGGASPAPRPDTAAAGDAARTGDADRGTGAEARSRPI